MAKIKLISSGVLIVSIMCLVLFSEVDASTLFMADSDLKERPINSSQAVWKSVSDHIDSSKTNDIDLNEALRVLKDLKPAAFTTEESKYGTSIGFIVEGGPVALVSSDEGNLDAMAMVVVLTKIVQEQQAALKEQNETMLQLYEKIIMIEESLPSPKIKKGLWKKGTE